MELTVIGCMGGYPTRDAATSSYLLTSGAFKLLIDCGSGAYQSLLDVTDPLAINAVLLTHYHFDHIADIGALQYAFLLKPTVEGAPQKRLALYGHGEDEWHRLVVVPQVTDFHTYAEQDTVTIGPFRVSFIKTVHPVTCYAVRITEQETGKTLVFTADSGFFEALIPFATGADVLLADCNFFNGQENHPVHMTAGEVGRIAQEAQCQHLVLTHLPAVSNTALLLEQAQEQTPHTTITLAAPHLTVTI